VVRVEGELTVVTDDGHYAALVIEQMALRTRFSATFPAPYFVTQWPSYGESYFDGLWREKGRQVHYMRYRKWR
jgi:hypothetical protein